jgi:hypothetical protein
MICWCTIITITAGLHECLSTLLGPVKRYKIPRDVQNWQDPQVCGKEEKVDVDANHNKW